MSNGKNTDLGWTEEAFDAAKPRPDTMRGVTLKQKTGCGNLFVTINEDEDGRPFEIFARLGKAGGCTSCLMDAIAIMLSHGLRMGINLQVYEAILRNLRCDNPIRGIENNGVPVHSCADGIAKVLQSYLTGKCRRRREGRILCWNNLVYDEDSKVYLCPQCDIKLGEKVELLEKIDSYFCEGSKWTVVARHDDEGNEPTFDLGESGVPEQTKNVPAHKLKKVKS